MQAPYAPNDIEMIRPVGNWDCSAGDAARTPIPGADNSRIDLRKVRYFTKLTERRHPRYQTAPPEIARVPPVPMADVAIKLRGSDHGAAETKSPHHISPVKLTIPEPVNGNQPLQATPRSPEPVKLILIPPHLRKVPTPAVPKLPLLQNKPAVKILRPPMPAPNSDSGNMNNLHENQGDVPSVTREQAEPKTAIGGAPRSSIESPRKTPSDPSSPESIDHSFRSRKGKQPAKVTNQGNSTPPMADSSRQSPETDGVLVEGAVVKRPGTEPRHPLLGWDGTWQEAPVDWSGRPLFNPHDKHRLKAMSTWIEQHAQETLENPVTVNTNVPGFGSGEALASGEKRLQAPIDSREHDTHLPDDDFTHAKKDGTADDALEKYRARIRVADRDVRVAEREAKAERRAYREAVREAAANYVPPPNPHTPRANIYIRPAILEDMAKIAELYNHYITHSTVAAEINQMTAQQWQTRWEDARENKYAFLVAVQSSPRGGGYSRRTSEEVLAGFAYADDYGGRDTAWRFTCEVQFFVAHWQLRAGVGKSLVDRMLTALDPVYVSRNGVQFSGARNSIQYEQGGERVVSQIMVGIPFVAKDDSEIKWKKQWLAQFKFQEVAIFPGIGRKMGKE